MAKKNQEKEESLLHDEVVKNELVSSDKTPEEFLSEYQKDNGGKTPSFGDWYSYREGYNKNQNLGDVTFKQWYTFKRQTIDQTKPFHPEWSVLGSKKCKIDLHDLSLESPVKEYKRLLAGHLLDNKEAE